MTRFTGNRENIFKVIFHLFLSWFSWCFYHFNWNYCFLFPKRWGLVINWFCIEVVLNNLCIKFNIEKLKTSETSTNFAQTTKKNTNNKMAKVKGYVLVNTQRCKGCNLCVVSCPEDVLELQPREVNDRGYHYVYMKNPEDCIGCANCGIVCPDGCLTVYRKRIVTDWL